MALQVGIGGAVAITPASIGKVKAIYRYAAAQKPEHAESPASAGLSFLYLY